MKTRRSNKAKIDWKLKNWSLVEERGKLVSENDFFLCLVLINGDNIGDTTAGAITVHGQSQRYETDGTVTSVTSRFRTQTTKNSQNLRLSFRGCIHFLYCVNSLLTTSCCASCLDIPLRYSASTNPYTYELPEPPTANGCLAKSPFSVANTWSVAEQETSELHEPPPQLPPTPPSAHLSTFPPVPAGHDEMRR